MALERHHVDHLVAVARFGNVTRAAAALGVTQPALSRSVRGLERKLGLRLFERVRSGGIPAPACRRLLASAQRLLGEFDALEREAQSLGGSFDGGFAIGLGPAVVAGSAMRAVGRLLTDHRRLACRIVTASALELLRRLREHALEFFVGDLTPLAGADEAFELEAFDYDGVLLCRAGHPALAARSPLAAALDHPIALLGPPPAGLAAVRALLREARPGLPST